MLVSRERIPASSAADPTTIQFTSVITAVVPITDIAASGVALHAMAGDAAAAAYGEYAMTPSDIIGAIPNVTRTFSDSRTPIYDAALANPDNT